jgi:apolipoprotein D and lipocalin family protein
MTFRTLLFGGLIALLTIACAPTKPQLETVPFVDLERFMGDWYVIANIPTFVEKGAHNAVESYSLNEDGSIATTFTFRDGSFDGKVKTYTPKGFVQDQETNALWGMRFIWPVKADYRIVYLDGDYTQTVIGRQKRDYIWIMARSPSISDADYQTLIDFAASIGYDTAAIQKVPQDWSDQSGRAPSQ